MLRLDRVANEVRPQEKTYTIDEVSKALDDLSVEDLLEELMDSPEFEEMLVTKGYVKKASDEIEGQLSMLEQEGSVEDSIVKPAKEVKKAEAGDDNPTEAPAATEEADKDEDEEAEIAKALGYFEGLLDAEGLEVSKGFMAAARKYLRKWRGKGGKWQYQYADDKKGGKSGKSDGKAEGSAGSYWESPAKKNESSQSGPRVSETSALVESISTSKQGFGDKGSEMATAVDKKKLKAATDRVQSDHSALVKQLSSGNVIDHEVKIRHFQNINALVKHGSISESAADSMRLEVREPAAKDVGGSAQGKVSDTIKDAHSAAMNMREPEHRDRAEKMVRDNHYKVMSDGANLDRETLLKHRDSISLVLKDKGKGMVEAIDKMIASKPKGE